MANEKLIYASAARRAILKADPRLAYVIDSVPAADAVKVVHGQWNRVKCFVNANLYHCSVCGNPEIRKYNYCSCCGSKMDGGNEDG